MNRIVVLLLSMTILLVCACKNASIEAETNEIKKGQTSNLIDITTQGVVSENTIEGVEVSGDKSAAAEAKQVLDPLNTTEQEAALLKNTGEEDKVIAERLIAKEELFEYILDHNVGLSTKDFEGIDMDDFIASRRITSRILHPSNLNTRTYLETALQDYNRDLEWNERAKYMAREKFSVESTNEEYDSFIKGFFEAINKEVVLSFSELDFTRYDIVVDLDTADTLNLFIAQTKNINELTVYHNEKRTHPELLEVFIGNGPDGAGMSGNFCYSKNRKFMMIVNIYDEQLFQYAKIFCAIDD